MSDDRTLETMARMWIDCDPNRQGGDLGSGSHPDDIMTEANGDLKGQPRWKWFVPRAEASLAYLEKHGFVLVAK